MTTVEPGLAAPIGLDPHSSEALPVSWLCRLQPEVFEGLCLRWMRRLGLADLAVRGISGMGLVEGSGSLDTSLETHRVFFRCIGDARPLTAPDVENARITLGRHGDRGLLVSAGPISAAAREAADRPDAPPILMIDGEQLLDALLAAGEVVCHRPSNTLMVVEVPANTVSTV